MENYKLITIFSSNSPLDCHILKGRLETEGLDCFIFDEYIITVHPFFAVAVRRAKLKVPSDQKDYGLRIMNCIKNNKLVDADGEYDCKMVFENEFKHQNEILNVKNSIRNNPLLLNNNEALRKYFSNDWMDDTELNKVISEETEFDNLTKKNVKIDWRSLLNDLFEYGLHVFDKIRIRPVNYYLDKELVDNCCKEDVEITNEYCPNCKSSNVKYSNAMDFKWDILFLLFSLLIKCPFPIVRSKYHCFDCGFNFKKREMRQ